MHPVTTFAAAFVLLSFPARAQEEPDFSALKVPVAEPAPMRFGVYGGVAGGWARRTADPNGDSAVSAGGEAAIVFNGIHGIRLGGQAASTDWGNATLKAFDLAHSFQLNTARSLDVVSGSFGLLFGPTLTLVECRTNPANDQTVLGVRLGIFADLNLKQFTLGLDATVRTGTQVAGFASADWMVTVGIHAGFTFELPVSSQHGTLVARADRRGRGTDP